MCGIIGYTGEMDTKQVLLQGLCALEYRGYDSAGIAVRNEATGKTTSDKATQAFVNTKGSEIDTGVNLTTLPYILVFAGVIVIAGAAFITRRRKYED